MAENASERESRPLKVVNRLLMIYSPTFFGWQVSYTKLVDCDVITLVWSVTKESVDIEDLVDDFVAFYFGGQDSTLSLLTFALVLTLLHPHVLEK